MNEKKKSLLTTVPAARELRKVPGFDPLKYLRTVSKDGEKVLKLDLCYKKVWFRLACPNGRMCLNPLRITDQMAIFEARLYANREDNASLLASFTSTQMARNVPGGLYIRAAQDEALNEALDNAGFGIQLCDVAQVSDGSGFGSEIPLSQVEAYAQTTTFAGTPVLEAEPLKASEPAAVPVEKAAEELKAADVSEPDANDEPDAPVQTAQEATVVTAANEASGQESAAELPAEEVAETAPIEEAPVFQEEASAADTSSTPENITVLPVTSSAELDSEAENGETANHAAEPAAQGGYTDDMTVEEICERMTMEEARDILVPLGTCKGWTLGQVLDRRPTSLRWYMIGCQDASNILKAGATLLWNYRQTQKAS